jgi:carboxyl-terminal processing protease
MSDLRLFNARVRWASLAMVFVLGTLISVGIWQSSWAEVTEPKAVERNVTKIVTGLMKERHLLRHPLNDEISQRAFKLFIDGLDPLKNYFYQQDIDDFKQYETKLDDMLSKENTQFANLVFQRFLQRVDERVVMIDELLAQPFDFTTDEEMVTEPDLLHYPKDPAEARDRWRQRIEYDLLVLKSDKPDASEVKTEKTPQDPTLEKRQFGSMSGQQTGNQPPKDAATLEKEAREKLSKRYHNFARRMKQFDNNELLEMFLTAVTSSFDPHTSYMSPNTVENFRISLQLKLEGIGAQLQDQDGKTVVAKVVPGGAAEKHGKLKKDDQIIAVGQENSTEMVDIVGMKLNDVVQLIRGDADTVVRLDVIPAGTNETVTYEITRAKIELEDEAAHGEIFEVGSKPDGTPVKVGVVDLPSFYLDMQALQNGSTTPRSATTDVRKILEDFKAKKVDSVVLDLRRNGGGSLIEAVDLTGLFIDRGPVVQVMDYDNNVDVHVDKNRGTSWDGPLVVVISKFSASASEILAAAIQDYQRGLVVGDEATHGKGTVQSLQDLGEVISRTYPPKLGALKITVQQFFRPNGESTQKRGVLSDIVLPSVTNYMDVGESDLDYAIDFRKIPRVDIASSQLVTNDIVGQLRQNSEKRISQSEGFAKELKRIDIYRQRKERKSVTLNEQKFIEEGKEFNADQEEQDRLEEQINATNKIKRDYYLDEVLAIAREYYDSLRQHKFANVN